MQPPDWFSLICRLGACLVFLTCAATSGWALESDRQQPLDVKADFTDGTLGDGLAILEGNVEIRQGTLLIKADRAEVEKLEGKVRSVFLTGTPVHLEQEIENEGLVQAEASTVEYQVAAGMVTLTGNADVRHPQYHVTGEVLKYDLNIQHFQGSGGDENGRIRILMEPEVVPDVINESGSGAQDAESE
jgi:lipopolysaccharide export system protein LptA